VTEDWVAGMGVSEIHFPHENSKKFPHLHRKVDVRLPGKGNSNSHGAPATFQAACCEA